MAKFVSHSSLHSAGRVSAGGVLLAALFLVYLFQSEPPRSVERERRVAQKDSDQPREPAPSVAAAHSEEVTGPMLYARHCAACHGEKGDGNGIAARFLEPKPRDFRAGRFRLVSSDKRPIAASAEDIEAILDRGMPGSSMISWAHLPPNERKLLAEQVLAFRRDGARAVVLQAAEDEGEKKTEQEIQAQVAELTSAGAPLAVPAFPAATAESIARGKALFAAKACASCHGATGKGDGQEKMVTSEGFLQRPRDLTLGIFKGDTDVASLYRRIRLGMPGSAMPATDKANLSDAEAVDLIQFVLSLSDEKTRRETVLRRQTITARRLASLPSKVHSADWKQVPAVVIGTTPLWWRLDAADPKLEVQAVHDGATLALRLTWRDATCDEQPLRVQDFDDLASIQFFKGAREPFIGMGMVEAPLDLWLWRAAWQRPYPESESQMDEYPFDTDKTDKAARPAGGQGGPPDFLTARAAGNVHANLDRRLSASNLKAKGFGTLTLQPRFGQTVASESSYANGTWTVVLWRPLEVPAEHGTAFAPGERISVAFALWDGAQRDRNGQKRISLWHELTLER